MEAKLSAEQITGRLADAPGWKASAEASIQRRFEFADHITAMGFAVRVGMIAEVLDHHPEMRIVYHTIDITLSTHDAEGVTEKDFALARKIDALT